MSLPKADRFVRFPIERSLRWESRSFYERMLGQSLYLEFQERPLPVGGDWKRAVCVRLGVPGRERANVCRALDSLVGEGLIVVSEGVLRLVYTDRPLDVHSTPTRRPPDLHSTSTQPPLDIHSDLNPGNHSGVSGEIDREIERKIERARVREVPVRTDWSKQPSPEPDDEPAGQRLPEPERTPLAILVRRRYEARLEAAGEQAPIWSPKNVQLAATLAQWLERTQGADPLAALERVLDAFFADPWATSARWPFANLVNRADKYLGGAGGSAGNLREAARKALADNDLDRWRDLTAKAKAAEKIHAAD